MALVLAMVQAGALAMATAIQKASQETQMCVYGVFIHFTQCLWCVYEVGLSVFMVGFSNLHNVYIMFMIKDRVAYKSSHGLSTQQ